VETPIVIPLGKTLDENRFFMLGDNSARSYDSRFWGDWYEATIPRSHLIGTPILVFWPPSRFRLID
jgi:type IV secretory pathway protease TraF